MYYLCIVVPGHWFSFVLLTMYLMTCTCFHVLTLVPFLLILWMEFDFFVYTKFCKLFLFESNKCLVLFLLHRNSYPYTFRFSVLELLPPPLGMQHMMHKTRVVFGKLKIWGEKSLFPTTLDLCILISPSLFLFFLPSLPASLTSL